MMEKHDEHYAKMKYQPMMVMEERMATPADSSMTTVQLLNLALAIKYILRAGRKPGQPWRKDIDKAQNYLHRAMVGVWLPTEDVCGDGYTSY